MAWKQSELLVCRLKKIGEIRPVFAVDFVNLCHGKWL